MPAGTKVACELPFAAFPGGFECGKSIPQVHTRVEGDALGWHALVDRSRNAQSNSRTSKGRVGESGLLLCCECLFCLFD